MKAIYRIFLVALLITVFIFIFIFFFIKLPHVQIYTASNVYDTKGQLIERLYVENRTQISLQKTPIYLQQAFIAIEDSRFYKHFGIDPIGILRAALINLKNGRIVEGGSTITQQLAKNLYLTHERTFSRKIYEALLTLKLELLYSKQEILEMYLNNIYFGHGTYGIETASKKYFGKSAQDLNLAESALLAGLPRSPEYYSPFRNYEAAKKRQELVLDSMVRAGFINSEECKEAKKTPILLAEANNKKNAPYFVQYILNEINRIDPEIAADLYRGGYDIYTTLDLELQHLAEKAFQKGIQIEQTPLNGVKQPQGALVAINPKNGHILAMIGGRDYSNTQFNRALAKRQPGSAFKPFLYLSLLEKGYRTIDQMICEPVEFPMENDKKYIPTDYDGGYHFCPIDIREALVISDNVVSVRWLNHIGVNSLISTARKMGIQSPLSENLSIALGSSEVTPLEICAAYAPFANGGYKIKPIALIRIKSKKGDIIFDENFGKIKVIDEKKAYIITHILKDVLKPGGTGSHLRINGSAAGKTGTSQGNKDAWFVGYTPDIVVSVYVGNDDPKNSLWNTGGWIAGPIWADFINESFTKFGSKDFEVPKGVNFVEICTETGLLANDTCQAKREVFVEGTEPKQICSIDHYLMPEEAKEKEMSRGHFSCSSKILSLPFSLSLNKSSVTFCSQ